MEQKIVSESVKAKRLRDKVFEIVDQANAEAPIDRHVSKLDALTVVQRSLQETKDQAYEQRKFRSLRDLSDFIVLTQSNKTSFYFPKNTDLLTIGHPRSTAKHEYSLDDYLQAKAKWVTADFGVSEEAKPLVASAIIHPCDSVEYKYAISRLQNLPQGLVSQEALLAAIGDGNSTLARRARAALQLRDLKGRFAWMGGAVRALFRLLNGDVKSFTGRYVADSPRAGFIQIEAPDESIYEVPSTSTEFIKALINPTSDGFSPTPAKYSSSDPVSDFSSVTKVESPNGWTRIDPNNSLGFTDGAFNAVISRDVDGKRKISLSTVDGTSVGDFDNWFDVQNELRGREVDIAGLARNEDGSEFDDAENRWANYPENAYQLARYVGYLPQGIPDGVEGATDNPRELASKFNKSDLVGALEEALTPIENVPANGRGLLGFEGGLQDIKAEAIYQALRMQGEDADLEVARIYDELLGTNENRDALSSERGEKAADVAEEVTRPDLEEEVRDTTEVVADTTELPELLRGLTADELEQFRSTGDYTPYLPQNEAIEMPQGYYTPNPQIIDPKSTDFINVRTPEDVEISNRAFLDAINRSSAPGRRIILTSGLPVGYTDEPIELAKKSTEDLEVSFRDGIEPGATPGYGKMRFLDDEGSERFANVSVEALRDALQLQGVDTNELLRQIKSEGGEGQKERVTESDATDILNQEGADTQVPTGPTEEEISRLRERAIPAFQEMRYDEDIINAVRDGASYEELKKLINKAPFDGYNSRWHYDYNDYDSRMWVDLPRAAQRAKWANFEKALDYVSAIRPADVSEDPGLIESSRRIPNREKETALDDNAQEKEIRNKISQVTDELIKQVDSLEESTLNADQDVVNTDPTIAALQAQINELNQINNNLRAELDAVMNPDGEQTTSNELNSEDLAKLYKSFFVRPPDLLRDEFIFDPGGDAIFVRDDWKEIIARRAEDYQLIANDAIANMQNPRNELPTSENTVPEKSEAPFLLNATPEDLQPGDIITGDHFVITEVVKTTASNLRDTYAPRDRSNRPWLFRDTYVIRGYYPGHQEQIYPEKLTARRQVRVYRNADTPERGENLAIDRPIPEDYIDGRRDPDYTRDYRAWRREVLTAKRRFNPPSNANEFVWVEDVDLKNSFWYRFVMHYNRFPPLEEKMLNLARRLQQIGEPNVLDPDSGPSGVTLPERPSDPPSSDEGSLEDQKARAEKEYVDLNEEIRQMLLDGIPIIDPRTAELIRLRDDAFNRMLDLSREIENRDNVTFIEPKVKVISVDDSKNKPKETPSTQKINEDPKETIPTPENTGSIEIELPNNQESMDEFARAYWEEMMRGVGSTEPMPENFPEILRKNLQIPVFINLTPQNGARLVYRGAVGEEGRYIWLNPDGSTVPYDPSDPRQAGKVEIGRIFKSDTITDQPAPTLPMSPTPIEDLPRDPDGNIIIPPPPPGSTPSTPPPVTQNINIPQNDIRRNRFDRDSGSFTSGEPASRVTQTIPTPNSTASDSDSSPFTVDGFRERVQSLLDQARRPMEGSPYREWQERNYIFADGINQVRLGDVVNHWGGDDNEFRGWGDGTVVAITPTENVGDRERIAYAWVYFPQAVVRDQTRERNLILDENGQPVRGPVYKKIAVRMLFLNRRGSTDELRNAQQNAYNNFRTDWQRNTRADRVRVPSTPQVLPSGVRPTPTPTPSPIENLPPLVDGVPVSAPTPEPTPTPPTPTPTQDLGQLEGSIPLAQRFLNRPLAARLSAERLREFSPSWRGVSEADPNYIDPDRIQNGASIEDFANAGWSPQQAANLARAAESRPSFSKIKELFEEYQTADSTERTRIKTEIGLRLEKVFGVGTTDFGRSSNIKVEISSLNIGSDGINIDFVFRDFLSPTNRRIGTSQRTLRNITADSFDFHEDVISIPSAEDKGSGFGESWKAYYDSWVFSNGGYKTTSAAGNGHWIGAYVWTGFGYGWETVATGVNQVKKMNAKVEEIRNKTVKNREDLIVIRDFDFHLNKAASALGLSVRDLLLSQPAAFRGVDENILQNFPTPRDLALVGFNPFATMGKTEDQLKKVKWFGKDFMIVNGWSAKKRGTPDNISLLQQESELYEYKRRRDSQDLLKTAFPPSAKLKEWFNDVDNYSDDLRPYFDEISTLFSQRKDTNPVGLLSTPARRILHDEIYTLLSNPAITDKKSLINVLDALNRDRVIFENPLTGNDSVLDEFRNLSSDQLMDVYRNSSEDTDSPLIVNGEDTGLKVRILSGTASRVMKVTDPSSQKVYYLKQQDSPFSSSPNAGSNAEIIANNIAKGLEIVGLPLINKIAGEDNGWIISTNAGGNLNIKPLELEGTSAEVDTGVFSLRPGDWSEVLRPEGSEYESSQIEVMNLVNIAILDALIANEDRHEFNSVMVENPQEGSSRQIQRWLPIPIDNAENTFGYNYETIREAPPSVKEYLQTSTGEFMDHLTFLNTEVLDEKTLKQLIDNRLSVLKNNLRESLGGGWISQEQLDLLESRIRDFEALTARDYKNIFGSRDE
jgi:hypothetical protein